MILLGKIDSLISERDMIKKITGGRPYSRMWERRSAIEIFFQGKYFTLKYRPNTRYKLDGGFYLYEKG